MADLLGLLAMPFLMCLVLTGIHAYLGIHVLAREVIFVDIAMAQIAAVGVSGAFLMGIETESWGAWGSSLAATTLGAMVLALSRSRKRRVSQEAVIGLVYAVASAAVVLLVSEAPHGAEHIRAMLVGSLLGVSGAEVLKVGALYAGVGALHWACRQPFFLISNDPDAAWGAGWRVRAWDFLFYASFGVVVASSVRIAGVLLVFSYLVAPAVAASLVGGPLPRRLVIGWAFGVAVSIAGMLASAGLDLPTGATIVCAFGAALLLLWIALRGRRAP
jgi:zinc/manganese transport system permease protein